VEVDRDRREPRRGRFLYYGGKTKHFLAGGNRGKRGGKGTARGRDAGFRIGNVWFKGGFTFFKPQTSIRIPEEVRKCVQVKDCRRLGHVIWEGEKVN